MDSDMDDTQRVVCCEIGDGEEMPPVGHHVVRAIGAAGEIVERAWNVLIATAAELESSSPCTHLASAHTPGGVVLVDADGGRRRVILRAAPPPLVSTNGDGRTL
jgi:hypothetical protein